MQYPTTVNALDTLMDELPPDAFEAGWDRVASRNSGPGTDGQTVAQFEARLWENLESLANDVYTFRYEPLPLLGAVLHTNHGDARPISIPPVRDRVVQAAVLDSIRTPIESAMLPCSYAYLPGRSYTDAVAQICEFRDAGNNHVLQGDVLQFFHRIRHDLLLQTLQQWGVHAYLRRLIAQWITTPTWDGRQLVDQSRGLPLGSVIAPLLANLFMHAFDTSMIGAGFNLVRYADDFIVCCKSAAEAEAALVQAKAALAPLKLSLSSDKTGITTFDDGFDFVGYHLSSGEPRKLLPRRVEHKALPAHPYSLAGAEQTTVPGETRAIWSRTPVGGAEDRRLLYVQHQGALVRYAGGEIIVQAPDGKGKPAKVLMRLPAMQVRAVLVFGRVALSPAARMFFLGERIPVVLLTRTGKVTGHLLPATGHPSVQLLRAQVHTADNEALRLSYARALVQAKLHNTRYFLQRRYHRSKIKQVKRAIRKLKRLLKDVAQATSLDQLRGYEGAGAAILFDVYGRLLKTKAFSFNGRTRRPPRDPVNVLLSLGYTLLFNYTHAIVASMRLQGHLGVYHEAADNHPALISDLMEPFRFLVDGLVLKLLNKRIMKPQRFKQVGQAVQLDKTGLRIFIAAFTEMMNGEADGSRLPYREMIELQARSFKHALLHGTAFKPYLAA